MKKKMIVDFIANSCLLVLAYIVLILPIFKVNDLKLVMMIIFACYTGIKFVQSILIVKEKDYESIYTAIISFGAFLALLFLPNKIKLLGLVLLVWMAFMCLVKLKKADFYDDRENKMWMLKIFILFIFLTTGLLVGLNLYVESSNIILVGFFFLINAVLETIDPIVRFLREN